MSMLDPVRDEEVVGPSNRSFGLTFCGLFLLVALAPLWRGGAPRMWALVVAALVGLVTFVSPRLLAPLNRLWLAIGLALHRVVNPVVMAVLFYVAVTPFGLVMRIFRKGLVRELRPDPLASSYWAPRDAVSRMDQQF